MGSMRATVRIRRMEQISTRAGSKNDEYKNKLDAIKHVFIMRNMFLL